MPEINTKFLFTARCPWPSRGTSTRRQRGYPMDGIRCWRHFRALAARMPSIPPAASPCASHDHMETDAAQAGNYQGRATRDAGAGRPQHAAPSRTRAAFA
jgi:hypothetical protein